MNRRLTALFAALEALLVAGVGVGVPLVPLTLMWAVQYGLQVDWVVFWRAAADLWLLGHGTDIRFTLDPAIAAATGLPGAGDPVVVTLAPLGFALLTVLLGVRAGRRIGEVPHRRTGQLVALATFTALSGVVVGTAGHAAAQPSVWQGLLFPVLVFALGVALGGEISRRRLGTDAGALRLRLRHVVEQRMPRLGPAIATAVAGGVAAATVVLAASALAVAVLVAANYGRIIALYEGVQSGALGGAALTVGQLALLPNLVIWGAAWFTGPGFALGTGSAVSPVGTAVGPLPALPVLGALPPNDLAFAFVTLLVPVLAGFLAGVLLRGRLLRIELGSRPWLVGTGLAVGVVAGMTLGVLALLSGGAAGPGRLVDVGPHPLLVGAWTALEVGVPAALALVVSRTRVHSAEEAEHPEPVAVG